MAYTETTVINNTFKESVSIKLIQFPLGKFPSLMI